MDNMPMETLQEIVGAFSSLEEDFGMVSTLHAMQLLDAVECDVEGKLDQAVDFHGPRRVRHDHACGFCTLGAGHQIRSLDIG